MDSSPRHEGEEDGKVRIGIDWILDFMIDFTEISYKLKSGSLFLLSNISV